jgi:hypothetical protein
MQVINHHDQDDTLLLEAGWTRTVVGTGLGPEVVWQAPDSAHVASRVEALEEVRQGRHLERYRQMARDLARACRERVYLVWHPPTCECSGYVSTIPYAVPDSYASEAERQSVDVEVFEPEGQQ